MIGKRGRPRRPWATAAAIVGGAVLVLFVLLVVRQSGSEDPIDLGPAVVVMVLLVGLAGLTVLGGRSPRARVRKVALAAAAIGWFVLGYIALWSVGSLLLLAGVLTTIALLRDRDAGPVGG
jgi:peptidoglycan/LPS O-acetylase OafA/YrhL